MAAVGIWLSAITFSYIGVGAVALALFIALDLSKGFPPESKGSFGLERRAPERALAGETILVELSVSNNGGNLERIHLEDEPPYQAKLERGSASLDAPLKKGAAVTLRYELVFREPGDYQFGVTGVTLRSMFGLSEKTFVFFAPFSIRIYPKLLRPKLSPVQAPAFGWAGMTQSAYRGGKLGFMNIREYAAGDTIRDLNWKATARFGRRLVNEWQVERGIDCVVIVDLFADDLPRVGGWSARGEVIEASYELVTSFLASGNRVGMLIMGEHLGKIKPGFGKRRLRAMVEEMVDSHEGEVWSVDNVEKYLEEFFRRQYLKRGGTMFFVSAGANMRLVNAVISLSRKGFTCNTVIVDTLKEEGSALSDERLLEPQEGEFGYRFAHAEFEWFEGLLASYSNVYEWNSQRGLIELRRRGR